MVFLNVSGKIILLNYYITRSKNLLDMQCLCETHPKGRTSPLTLCSTWDDFWLLLAVYSYSMILTVKHHKWEGRRVCAKIIVSYRW